MADRKYEPPWCWMALGTLAFNMFAMDGMVRCYGLYYLELLDLFGQGAKMTGYVGTLFAVFGAITSPIAGIAMDNLSARVLLLCMPFVVVLGGFIAAFAVSIAMVYVGYSVFIGLANTSCFVVNTAEVTRLFKYNRTFATGIVFSAGSVGSMIYPLLFNAITNTYSVRGVILILYTGFHLNIVVSSFVLRFENVFKDSEEPEQGEEMLSLNQDEKAEIKIDQNSSDDKIEEAKELVESSEKKAIVDTEEGQNSTKAKSRLNECASVALKLLNVKFLSLIFFYVLWVFSLYGFQMYTPAYAKELGLSKIYGSILLSVCGAADLISRFGIGFIGNLKFVNIYLLITINLILTGVYFLFVPNIISLGDPFVILMLSLIILGIFLGGLTSLLGQLVADSVGVEVVGTAFGILNVSFCIGIGLPPVVYGSMYELTGSYSNVARVSGATMILSGLCIQVGQIWEKVSLRLQPRTEEAEVKT